MHKYKNKYQAFFENSADAMLIIENGVFVDCNSAAVTMLNYARKEELINAPPVKLSPEFQPDDRPSLDKSIKMMQYAKEHGSHRFEWNHLRKDGTIIPVEVSLTAIKIKDGIQLHTVWRDISTRKKAEQQIQELVLQLETERDLAQRHSLIDSLTGLPNRRCFDNIFQTEFSRHKRFGSELSLIMLDVDHFKKYNDYYGHLEGDNCLRQIARTLKSVVVRGTDVVARYGGEEFAAILPGTNCQGATALAVCIAESLQKLALPHAKSDIAEFVTVSLGIASAVDHSLTDRAQLFSLADKELYRAKRNGRNRYEISATSA